MDGQLSYVEPQVLGSASPEAMSGPVCKNLEHPLHPTGSRANSQPGNVDTQATLSALPATGPPAGFPQNSSG